MPTWIIKACRRILQVVSEQGVCDFSIIKVDDAYFIRVGGGKLEKLSE